MFSYISQDRHPAPRSLEKRSLCVGHNPGERWPLNNISSLLPATLDPSLWWESTPLLCSFIGSSGINKKQTQNLGILVNDLPFVCVTILYRQNGKYLKTAITLCHHLYSIAHTFWETLLNIRYNTLQNFNGMTPEILYPRFQFYYYFSFLVAVGNRKREGSH